MLENTDLIITALQQTKSNTKTTKKASYFAEFSQERGIEAKYLSLKVSKIGTVHFPLQKSVIHQLIEKSQPAKFGFKELTLENPTIRHTHEISGKQLTVKLNENIKQKLLKEMQTAFGLPSYAQLTLQVHNLLIYEPGHFFKKHQDSEKIPNMLGTFVMILPSAHIGGDLVIYHGNEEHRFVSSHLNLSRLPCIGFYADNPHVIEKVQEGYRVALTFYIALAAPAKKLWQTNLAQWKNPALISALAKYFDKKSSINDHPQMLTYLLDHEYSSHGLNWGGLKGRDSQDAFSFLDAANTLDLQAYLVLVEVHELWNTMWDSGLGRGHTSFLGEELDELITEIIDEEIILNYWIDSQNKSLPYGQHYLRENEVCWIKPTKAFKPTETEYEGWMGNYGNTADYWYQRAAIVLWQVKDQTRMEFKLCYKLSLNKLLALTKTQGQELQVITLIDRAGAYLYPPYRAWEEAVIPFMDIAKYINEPKRANTLLANVPLILAITQSIPHLVALQNQYGLDWCLTLLKRWITDTKKTSYNGRNLLQNIDTWVYEALNSGIEEKYIAQVLQYQSYNLLKNDRQSVKYNEKNRIDSTPDRLKNIENLLKGCFFITSAIPIVESLLSHIKKYKKLYDTVPLTHLYLSIPPTDSHTYKKLLQDFGGYLAKNIHTELGKGLRNPDDWSIIKKLDCSCEYCHTVKDFLRSKTHYQKIWSLAQVHRSHIEHILNQFRLPITLKTIKQGSPHKLVVEKTKQLYEDAKKRYETLCALAKKLHSHPLLRINES